MLVLDDLQTTNTLKSCATLHIEKHKDLAVVFPFRLDAAATASFMLVSLSKSLDLVSQKTIMRQNVIVSGLKTHLFISGLFFTMSTASPKYRVS